jgi:hypothetical protein
LYHSVLSLCCAGKSSMNSLKRPSRNDQPALQVVDQAMRLVLVAMPMRRMPELRQLESAKSMI